MKQLAKENIFNKVMIDKKSKTKEISLSRENKQIFEDNHEMR